MGNEIQIRPQVEKFFYLLTSLINLNISCELQSSACLYEDLTIAFKCPSCLEDRAYLIKHLVEQIVASFATHVWGFYSKERNLWVSFLRWSKVACLWLVRSLTDLFLSKSANSNTFRMTISSEKECSLSCLLIRFHEQRCYLWYWCCLQA